MDIFGKMDSFSQSDDAESTADAEATLEQYEIAHERILALLHALSLDHGLFGKLGEVVENFDQLLDDVSDLLEQIGLVGPVFEGEAENVAKLHSFMEESLYNFSKIFRDCRDAREKLSQDFPQAPLPLALRDSLSAGAKLDMAMSAAEPMYESYDRMLELFHDLSRAIDTLIGELQKAAEFFWHVVARWQSFVGLGESMLDDFTILDDDRFTKKFTLGLSVTDRAILVVEPLQESLRIFGRMMVSIGIFGDAIAMRLASLTPEAVFDGARTQWQNVQWEIKRRKPQEIPRALPPPLPPRRPRPPQDPGSHVEESGHLPEGQ